MQFLVTGGAGFIGSHLVEALLSEGHQVTVIDDFSTGKRQNLKEVSGLTIIENNILECTAQAIPGGFDGLAHLAATPSIRQSWQEPLATHDNNISATVKVIQLCQQLAIPRLVFASSAAVYGNPERVPIVEEAAKQPLSPYGLHKLVGEQYIDLFAKQFGFTAVNLRLFNVFGPRQDPTSPYSGVISIFVRAMMHGTPITINGDGKQTRDFVYVKNVAAAFSQALTVPLPSSNSPLTCNIGTGKALSLLQLKAELQQCFPEWSAETAFKSPRLGDVRDSLADISKARQQLGFTAQYSVQQGLQAVKESLMKLY
jgi:UDP-glucose 4-epimerase